jgi:hypothetical protein
MASHMPQYEPEQQYTPETRIFKQLLIDDPFCRYQMNNLSFLRITHGKTMEKV